MFRYLKILYLIAFSVLINAQNKTTDLQPDKNFPQWLKTEHSRTNQTSGIAFLKSESDKKYFILADDIGYIHLLTIKSDLVFSIEEVSFVGDAENYFSDFPKKDFEDILYDKNTNEVYLSVEGNGKNFKDYVGIYKLVFKDNDIFSKQIISVTKMNFTPETLFYKYTDWNIGYEGITVDKNYFYLGLEGFVTDKIFADSALIFIADKSDLNIIKEVSTKDLGIYTICGLFSDKDYSLWGIDRNNRQIFHILFDEAFNIKDFSVFDAFAYIPKYHNLNYSASYESIAMDEENNLYIVVDPWEKVYVPQQDILDKLDNETINNFKQYIPVIFKFKVTYP